jgi:hypothetical protein
MMCALLEVCLLFELCSFTPACISMIDFVAVLELNAVTLASVSELSCSRHGLVCVCQFRRYHRVGLFS